MVHNPALNRPITFCPAAPKARGAFTLVELLVVIAIIGILVAVLLPSISMIRGKAKYADASAQFVSFQAGLEAFRAEEALGGSFPPSRSDYSAGSSVNDRQRIANPLSDQPSVNMPTSGAHLLIHALVGADLLGPPGFKDVNRDGTWSNDTHRGVGGAYEINASTGDRVHTRYGGPGNSYVDEKMKNRIRTLKEMRDQGLLAAIRDESQLGQTALEQSLFVDPWDRPILYYRANPAAKLIAGTANRQSPGIFEQNDNALITGDDTWSGIDFGPGLLQPLNKLHALQPAFPTFSDKLDTPPFENTFAKFIRDPSITAAATPVRKDSYLLISAGPDGHYGTTDDVTNWPREKN